ncbi:translation initiation factor IF-3 [Candidatus Uhrbacteria bacterium]|nr:translation initiation factor IF-3 [Candidatus Uhrbacteria bacterium]
MRKNFRRAPTQAPTRTYRTNRAITALEVRLLDENNEHVGVVPLEEALQRAQEVESDLVEIEPKAVPPVCKIMDYGKLKYTLEKELRKARARQKKTEVKGLRISLRIGQHDLEVRIAQAKKFLEGNDKVKLEMVLRGRERQHTNLARDIMSQFVKRLEEEGVPANMESPISMQGGRLNVIIGSKKS